MIITIDGPTASGKTTVARMLAHTLGYYYLSSGLLFRGLAYALIHEYDYTQQSLAHPQQEDVDRALKEGRFTYHYDAESAEQLFFDGQNIAPLLRSEFISQSASIIATDAYVRHKLIDLQHTIANAHNVVAEGRDMGTIVFPHAQVKFFLTASLDVRATRWQNDRRAHGKIISFQEALHDVQSRDERDMHRSLAPLRIPEGAALIDDSCRPKEEVLKIMIDAVKKSI